MRGLRPHCAVIVATVRALKSHGGGPPVPPGKTLDPVYTEENVGMVEKGCANLIRHICTVKKAGISPVVCINPFPTDTAREIAEITRQAEAAGARVALSHHWRRGGEGALELTDAVIDACGDRNNFNFLYDLGMPLSKRIETIAREVYGASGVKYLPDAEVKLAKMEKDPELSQLGTCMVKTHLSISHDPELKGVPTDWVLPVRDIMVFRGAGFVVPVAGAISLMPGTASDPAFRRIDVDLERRKVTGVF